MKSFCTTFCSPSTPSNWIVVPCPRDTSTFGWNDQLPANLSGNLARLGTSPAYIESRASTISFAFGISKRDILNPVRLVRSFAHFLTLVSEVTPGSGRNSAHCRRRCRNWRCIIHQLPKMRAIITNWNEKNEKKWRRRWNSESAQVSSPVPPELIISLKPVLNPLPAPRCTTT